MSVFTKALTSKGIALQAKAQAGVKLNYSRFAIGDGRLSGQLLPTMTNLISTKKSVPVTKLKMRPPDEAIVGFTLSNQDVTTGFYFRELGLYAMDPDEGEILYLYANAGETADYIPPAESSDVVEKSFDVRAFVGQAQNVTANIDQSLVYVSHPELEEALAMIDVDIPDASLTLKGKTKLSNATNSTSETEAATPKAVKAAYDRGSAGVSAAATAQAKADSAYAEALAGKQAGIDRKTEVVAALNSIGITASTSESWAQLIPKMAAIIKATGNATAADVLIGKTYSNEGANGLTGAMPNNGNVTRNLTTQNAEYIIPKGYHDGAGKVKATYVEGKPFITGSITIPFRSDAYISPGWPIHHVGIATNGLGTATYDLLLGLLRNQSFIDNQFNLELFGSSQARVRGELYTNAAATYQVVGK